MKDAVSAVALDVVLKGERGTSMLVFLVDRTLDNVFSLCHNYFQTPFEGLDIDSNSIGN